MFAIEATTSVCEANLEYSLKLSQSYWGERERGGGL